MIFILATKLKNLNLDRKEHGEKFLKLVKEKVPNVKWIAHYAILGPYDFIDIFETDNEREAAKVSLLSRIIGADFAESWTAIKYTEFLKLVEDLE
ncbi:MAG: GYD domain-containing protein [Candidatus Lokiarchaeota archaeon]|nr:GYD domain-containing protein [Candidatus Lokiarchaeota archaeon]